MGQSVREQFLQQSRSCLAMGSPLTARILSLLASDIALGNPLTERVLGWPGPASDALPLRLAGGLHSLVRSGNATDLQNFYRSNQKFDDQQAITILRAALAEHAIYLNAWLDSPPQTNELRRSAVLIAAAHWLSDRFKLPLELSEIGASAGLNMIWDHYALHLGGQTYGPNDAPLTLSPQWEGDFPPTVSPVVLSRAGVDRSPIDPTRDRERLLSYIWADQADRLARTEKALDLVAFLGVRPEKGEALPWIRKRLAIAYPGRLHLLYHTIVWQYLTPTERAEGEGLIAQAGAKATVDAPLAHLAMEEDGRKPGVGLRITLWPGMLQLQLGRADAHGRWIIWSPEIV
ncbi:DUF2332 domain-containing protein [Neogemmobacter tilapiae]|uniref:DUF2332 domain-containing protein n=1 Tax=Neogemmobacter tilapiae TaxID=875041 RepID=A0A918TMJ6_9RHOB|nr:DUF2332 family protein [Gemmobacter tilapiae]GHC54315.1 hypothetical protein GCM10007315_16490 [Gemmobacter tilapiae]